MSVVPLLVILDLGYLLYSWIRESSTRQSDPALDELKIAYARGELSDEEFERRRKRLEQEW